MNYPTDVIAPAWVFAAIILLVVGVFQFLVFFLEGLFSTTPVPIRWWLVPVNTIFAVILVLIAQGRWT